MPIVCSTLRSNTVYLILFILITAVLPGSVAPSEFISSSTPTPICIEARQWPNFCFALKNSTLLSVRAQEELTRREGRAREMFCDMAKLLTRIDCNQPYSVNQEQSLQCQEAYRDWACSVIAENGDNDEFGEDESGKKIPLTSRSLMPFPSCDSVCHRVLRVCPYLTPDRNQLGPSGTPALHPSQYGGHPAFYCSRRSALLFTALKSQSQHPEKSSKHHYFYQSGNEVNLTDELINSNDTSCCWTYSAALKTEQFPQSSPSSDEEEFEGFQRGTDRPVIPSAAQLSENQVQIQCLHVQREILINLEDNFVDGGYEQREENSDDFISVGGGGGASGGVGESQRLVNSLPSKLALSRAIKADMVATIVETGGGGGSEKESPVVTTIVGDSSEANYYLRDDWFEVSSSHSSSKSIQKRNNYNNFLSLVSSSSGEEDDPDNVEEDTDSNDGLVRGGGGGRGGEGEGHRHQSELEQGGTISRRSASESESRRRRRRQDMTTATTSDNDMEEEEEEEFMSMDDEDDEDDVHLNKRSVGAEGKLGQHGQQQQRPHHLHLVSGGDIKSSAKSSASRQQPFIHFPISLPLPVITIHHNRCFPVLLLLLLIMILLLLLLLMVLLTTNFLPKNLQLKTTTFVSSTLVQRNNDEDKTKEEREMMLKSGGEGGNYDKMGTTTVSVMPISSSHCEYHQKRSMMMMNLPQKQKNNNIYNNKYSDVVGSDKRNNSRKDNYYCYYNCCCSYYYCGTIYFLKKHTDTVVRSQTSQYLVKIMMKLSTSSRSWKSKVHRHSIATLNKLKKWFMEWIVPHVTHSQKQFLRITMKTMSLIIQNAVPSITASSSATVIGTGNVVDLHLVHINTIILHYWRTLFQRMKNKTPTVLFVVVVVVEKSDDGGGGGSVDYEGGGLRRHSRKDHDPIMTLTSSPSTTPRSLNPISRLHSVVHRICENVVLEQLLLLFLLLNNNDFNLSRRINTLMTIMTSTTIKRNYKKEETIKIYYRNVSTSTVTVITILLTKNPFSRPLLLYLVLLLLLLLILLIPRLKLLILLLIILMPLRFILSSRVLFRLRADMDHRVWSVHSFQSA